MNSADLTLGISQITTRPWSLEQDLKIFRRLGMGIELNEFKFDSSQIEDQLDFVKNSGITIVSVQTNVQSVFPSDDSPLPESLQVRLDKIRESIKKFGRIALGCPFILSTGSSFDGNEDEVWKSCVKHFKELSKYADGHGVKIALEPLSPSLMNRGSILYNLPQAIEMAVEVDELNFGICVDFYNIWQDSLAEKHILDCEDMIFLVQYSDWRRPRSFHDRHIPGHGEIPLGCLLKAVKDTGYQGAYVLEILSDHVPDSLWNQDLELVIEKSQEGFVKAWDWALE